MKTDLLLCVWATTLIPAVDEWMNEWMSTCRGEGEKEMHVWPTMLASHNKLWISLFFGVERCETVFIIIMKIIMIIMMVIKGKNLTTNVTLLPHTLTLLNSVPPAPGTGWRSAGISWVSWFRVLPPNGVGTSNVWGPGPLLQQEAGPLVILSVHFHLSKYIQENCFLLFSCLDFLHCYTLMLQHRN